MLAPLPGKHLCVHDETHITPEKKGLVQPGVWSPRLTSYVQWKMSSAQRNVTQGLMHKYTNTLLETELQVGFFFCGGLTKNNTPKTRQTHLAQRAVSYV